MNAPKGRSNVRLDVKALAIAMGLFWGLVMLVVGIADLIWGGYGGAFLDVMDSVYPGYDGPGGVWEVIVGVLYGLFDGAIAGLVFGWLYNLVAGPPRVA